MEVGIHSTWTSTLGRCNKCLQISTFEGHYVVWACVVPFLFIAPVPRLRQRDDLCSSSVEAEAGVGCTFMPHTIRYNTIRYNTTQCNSTIFSSFIHFWLNNENVEDPAVKFRALQLASPVTACDPVSIIWAKAQLVQMAVRFLTQQPETAKPIARSKMDSTSYLDFLKLKRVLLVGKSFLCIGAGFWGIQNTLPISGLYQSYGSTFAWILTPSGCVLDRFRRASVPAGTAGLQQGWAQQISVDPDRRFSSKKSLILQLQNLH